MRHTIGFVYKDFPRENSLSGKDTPNIGGTTLQAQIPDSIDGIKETATTH